MTNNYTNLEKKEIKREKEELVAEKEHKIKTL